MLPKAAWVRRATSFWRPCRIIVARPSVSSDLWSHVNPPPSQSGLPRCHTRWIQSGDLGRIANSASRANLAFGIFGHRVQCAAHPRGERFRGHILGFASVAELPAFHRPDRRGLFFFFIIYRPSGTLNASVARSVFSHASPNAGKCGCARCTFERTASPLPKNRLFSSAMVARFD